MSLISNIFDIPSLIVSATSLFFTSSVLEVTLYKTSKPPVYSIANLLESITDGIHIAIAITIVKMLTTYANILRIKLPPIIVLKKFKSSFN